MLGRIIQLPAWLYMLLLIWVKIPETRLVNDFFPLFKSVLQWQTHHMQATAHVHPTRKDLGLIISSDWTSLSQPWSPFSDPVFKIHYLPFPLVLFLHQSAVLPFVFNLVNDLQIEVHSHLHLSHYLIGLVLVLSCDHCQYCYRRQRSHQGMSMSPLTVTDEEFGLSNADLPLWRRYLHLDGRWVRERRQNRICMSLRVCRDERWHRGLSGEKAML